VLRSSGVVFNPPSFSINPYRLNILLYGTMQLTKFRVVSTIE